MESYKVGKYLDLEYNPILFKDEGYAKVLDDNICAIASKDNMVVLVSRKNVYRVLLPNIRNWESVRLPFPTTWVYSVEIIPMEADFCHILMGLKGGELVSCSSTDLRFETIHEFDTSITIINHIPFSKEMFIGCADGSVYLFSLDSKIVTKYSSSSKSSILHVGFNSHSVISINQEGLLIRWNRKTAETTSEVSLKKPLEGYDILTSAVFSRETETVLCSFKKKEIFFLFETSSGSVKESFKGKHKNQVNSCSFSPCEKFIVSSSDDKKNVVWRSDEAIPLGELKGHTQAVETSIFSSDGSFIISTGWDSTIHYWKFTAPPSFKKSASSVLKK